MQLPGSSVRWRAVFVLGVCLGWLWLSVAIGHAFGPWYSSVRTFAADNAIVVLMANDPSLDPFHLYYFGQDRFGAWPFLLMQLARNAFGISWTVDAIYLVQTMWLCAGALALGALVRRFALYLAVAYLGAVAFNVAVAPYIFQIGQPYAWQLPSLLFAWWAMRALCETTIFPADRRKWRFVVFGAATVGCGLLAVWSSVVSGPLLAFVALVETVRAAVIRRSMAGAGDGLFRRARLPLATVIVAVVAERFIHELYHRDSLARFGQSFRTPMDLDWANVIANANGLQVYVTKHPWFPMLAFAILGAAAVTALVPVLVGRRTLAPERSAALPVLPRTPDLPDTALLDLALLVVASVALAGLNFIGAAALTWVRINGLDARYVLVSSFFLTIGGAALIPLSMAILPPVRRQQYALNIVVSVVALVVAVAAIPPAEANREYRAMQAAAAQFADSSSQSVVLGSYWDAYLLAGLAPAGRVIPIPLEGEVVRTPWTPRMLHTADYVILVRGPDTRDAPLPLSINSYGQRFALVDPLVFENDLFRFARYARLSAAR